MTSRNRPIRSWAESQNWFQCGQLICEISCVCGPRCCRFWRQILVVANKTATFERFFRHGFQTPVSSTNVHDARCTASIRFHRKTLRFVCSVSRWILNCQIFRERYCLLAVILIFIFHILLLYLFEKKQRKRKFDKIAIYFRLLFVMIVER